MLESRAVHANDSSDADRATFGPVRAGAGTGREKDGNGDAEGTGGTRKGREGRGRDGRDAALS